MERCYNAPSQPDQRNRGDSVARRRYQQGSVKFVNGKFVGRWREDVILANGTIKRLNRKKVFGTKEDFKTKREARRAMDLILSPINSLAYRPTHQITFAEFARRWGRAVVRFYNKRGTAEQWIKEGKQAVKMTWLSCHHLRSNEARLWLSVLAYNLGNLLRRLVLPKRIDHWSLTSLQ